MSRRFLLGRGRAGTYSVSESSGDLPYLDMAQLHPPYVVEATAVDVKERANEPKRFVFQIDLKWSDDTYSTSYRSYSEFFDFQCDLLTQFPKEAGSVKGHERALPFLPGKKLFQKSNKKLAESRLTQIDEYVRALVSLPETIVQCEITCRFFKSNWQEDKLRSGEGSTVVRYTVKTLSQDQHITGTLSSRESSEAPLSPDASETQDRNEFTLSKGQVSGV